MKKRYYFDNSRMVYSGELKVVGAAAFKTIQGDHTRGDWMHHWISGEFSSLDEAREYFAKEWGKK